MTRMIGFLSCPLAFMLLVLVGCDDTTPVPPAPRYVLSATALRDAAGAMRLTGTVQAKVISSLSFQTPGRIVSRHVEVGDAVAAGEVLAQLDPLALAFSVQSAQANLQDSHAKLRTALLTAQRQRTLAAAKVASTEEREVAEQGLTAAQQAVREAQARLRKTTEQMSDADLTAPFNGVITSVSLESGQTVSAGQTVLEIANTGLRDAVFDVPEAQLADIHLGQRVQITLQRDPTVKCTGDLREISPASDTTTRLRRVKVSINNAPDSFRIGGAVISDTAFTPSGNTVLRVPATAVFERQYAHYVWVINPSTMTVSPRKIQLAGSLQTGGVTVLNGLQAGEKIVTAGVNALQPGQKIRIERKATP